MNIITNLEKIKQEIKNNTASKAVEIIAVSKTFPINHIMPLVNHGHRHFGENKVQEAEKKWKEVKKSVKDLKLHMIGRLQSNKAKKAIELFDYIHSLDSEKLANELSKRQKEKGKNLGYFIQLNLGSEDQKGGLEIKDLKSFHDHCVNKLNLLVLGLMAIPPNDESPEKYFEKISELNRQYDFNFLSLGMSNDYLTAIKYGSSHVRIGSSIFGARS